MRVIRRFNGSLAGALTVMASLLALTPVQAQSDKTTRTVSGVQKFEGRLADGTPYRLQKPSNWNGILVSDLDGIEDGDTETYYLLLKAGYGTASVMRRSYDRTWTLNRWDDMQRPLQAAELFHAKFGKPRLRIAFGHSAGGAGTLLTAERHPDRVDGAVAMCATMDFIGYAGYNLIFDFFYIAKTLLAPNDEQLRLPPMPSDAEKARPFRNHWAAVLEEAIQTPEGRARIALAFTLAQYSSFGSHLNFKGVPKPDYSNPKSVVDAMLQSLPTIQRRLGVGTTHDASDFPPDLEIPGTPVPPLVGNDGVVYTDYWKHANPVYKRTTEAVYAEAKLDLAADLRTLDASPRVNLNRDTLRSGVLGRGLPTMPVLRVDNLGDQTAPPPMSRLYDQLVARNGLTSLYRTAYVDNSGHCYFKGEQEFAAIEVMRERLESGKWPATDAAALNARAGRNDGDGVIFVDAGPTTNPPLWRLERYTDLFQPATFATTSTLVSRYRYSVTPDQRKQLLAALADAERSAGEGKANAALDRFVELVNGISNRVVRTRLLAAAYQLRGQD